MPLGKLYGLKARLLILILLAMLPVLCIALYMAVDDYHTAKVAAVENSRRLTRAYAAKGNTLLERAKQIMRRAANETGGRLDPAQCERIMSSLATQHSFLHNVSIFRPDGQTVCATTPPASVYAVRYLDWFQEALRTKAFVLGPYQRDAVDGAAELPLALPVLAPDGSVRLVLTLALTLESLSDTLQDQPLPLGASASIIDRSGTILARFPAAASAVGKPAPESETFLPSYLRQAQDAWEAQGLDGVRRIYFITPLVGAGERALFLRVGMPLDAAFATANRALLRNLSFIGLMAGLVLLSFWLFSNALVLRHIQTLWLATKKLTEGNYSYRIGSTGSGELGELALAFDHLAGVLEARTAQLTSAELKYREIFENSIAGICQTTPDGRILAANRAMARLLGYSDAEEFIEKVRDFGMDVYSLPGERRAVMDRLNREGFVTNLEMPARHADGSEVWLSMDARTIRTPGGEVAYYEAMISDITLRKEMEQELKGKQEKLQALLDYSPALISIKDAEGRYLLSNRRHQEVRNVAMPVLGRRVDEIFPPEVARQIRQEDAQVLAEGKPITFERPFSYNNETRHFVSIKFPLYDESNSPSRVGSISYDVTDLERVREALHQSEEKFRIMIQTSPDLIWLIDPQGVLVEVNSSSRELIGYDPEELRGKHFHQFFHAEDLRDHDREMVLPHFLGSGQPSREHPQLINERRQLPRCTQNLNLRLISKPGAQHDAPPRSFELSSSGLWQDMQFVGTIVVIRDITQRRQAEDALRQSRELLKQTQAMARIGGWTVNLDSRAMSWTEEAGRLLGYAGGEAPDFWNCRDFLAKEDREVFRQALAQAEGAGEPFDLELRLCNCAGSQAWVRIMGRRADAEGARLLSGTIQDITDRMALEHLRADIDSIIRHDLKTPLNGIINLPQLMKTAENLTEVQVEFLQFIEDSGRNMLRQIDMSLDLMKIERGQYVCAPATFDLLPSLREILRLLRESARSKRVEMAVDIDGQPLTEQSVFPVWGEERLYHPLLSNLLVNALEASPTGERIDVRLEGGQNARIVIRNRGAVPEELRERFFEKYATSGKSTGTGLGTYSAMLFARAQQGSVELDTGEPDATTVRVCLPRPPHDGEDFGMA